MPLPLKQRVRRKLVESNYSWKGNNLSPSIKTISEFSPIFLYSQKINLTVYICQSGRPGPLIGENKNHKNNINKIKHNNGMIFAHLKCASSGRPGRDELVFPIPTLWLIRNHHSPSFPSEQQSDSGHPFSRFHKETQLPGSWTYLMINF